MNKKQFKFSKLHILALSLVVFITGVFAAIFGMKRSPIISGASTTYNFETITLNDSAFTLVSNSDNKYPDVGSGGSYLVFNGNITIPGTHTGTYDEWELNIPSQYKYSGITYKVKEIRTGEVNAGATGFIYDNIFPKKTVTGVEPDQYSKYESLGIPVDKIKKVTVNNGIEYIQKGSFHGFTHLEEISVPFSGTSRLAGYEEKPVLGGSPLIVESPNGAFLAIFGDQTYLPLSGQDDNGKDWVNHDYYQFYQDTAPYTGVALGANGLVPWHLTTESDASAYFVVPPNLQTVHITDAVTIAGDAFFQNPLYKHIDVTFGNMSDTLAPIDGDGNKITGSTGFLQFAEADNYMSIGDYAFANCSGLVEAVLPEMASYGDGLFSQCKSLTTVDLPDTLSTLNKNTFFQCISLQKIKLPSNLTVIDDHAFDLCSELTTISSKSKAEEENKFLIPDNVTRIGICAFRFTAPKSVIVPDTVQEISYMAFNGLKNVTDMTLPFIGRERGNQLTVESLFGFIFGDYGAGWGITHGVGAIDDLMKAELPNAKIQDADGDESTTDLQGRYYIPLTLRNVVITDETVVGLGSFWNCDMLTSLTIQSTVKDAVLDTVTQIKQGALKGCSNLVSLSIPFVGASDSISGGHLGYIFGTVTFDKAVQVQGTSYFIPSTLKTVELSHATTVKTHSFYYVKTVTKFVIGAKTRTMERNVFTGNSGMRELSIPFIGRERGIIHDYPNSYYWDRWHKDTIRNSVLWLFEYASADEMYVNYYITSSTWYPGDFAGYIPASLKTINVTNDTYIPYAAFWGFSSLTDINILDQDNILEHIDGTIMKGCSNLENIQAPFIGQDANPYSYNNTNYVLGYWFGTDAYSNSYAAYQNGATFYIPKTLTRVNFEDRMSTLANYVFANATSVRAIHSKAPIRQLGAYAFANCTSLTELSLTEAIYTIVGSGAFMNDKALGEMTSFITQLTDDTDNLITRVNDYAFYGTAVTELHLKNYSYVGDYAFAKCLELKKVDFTGTFYTYVGKHLFDGCSHLTDITLTTYANDYMFANCTALEDIELDYLTQNNGGYIPAGFLYNCYNLKDGTSSGSSAIGGLPTAIMYSGLGLSPLTSGVKEIGEYAFAGCKSLTSFVLPETLEKIGDGAFQNCTGLSMLRIPRNTIKMSPGSKILDSGDIQDLTSTGIFYGCNKDFYLQVFYPEVDWPSGWGYNWNCYYPVYIIGDSTENWFTYEYSPEYKGYLITGLNIFSADNPEGYSFSEFFNDYDSATSEYLSPVLSGTIVFPNTHDGLFVFGIKEDAFSDQQSGSILRNVDNYVLSQNCRHLGSDCLNILDYYTTPTRFGKAKLITIFSNRTSANAQTYPEMHYGNEGFYTERATIAYKEAWTYVATRPTIYMSAVAATLDSTSYIYDLGSAIEPDIISLTKNSTSVRYAESDTLAETHLDDLVKNAFHNVSGGIYQGVNLSSISVTYSDNINVGTGHVYIKSNDSRFTGTLDVSFRIEPYQVDLFNESDIYKDLYENTYERYIDFAFDAVADEQDPLLHPDAASLIYHKEFNGKYWTWSNWTQGSSAYGLPDGYSLTGTLRTTDFQAGFYGMYQKTDPTTGAITNPTMAGVLVDYANNPISPVGGFEWVGSPHVWNSSGKDVTYNFKFVITNLVEIKPFEIDSTNITWDGQYNQVSGYYEYEYAGGPIVPVPTVKNEDYVTLPLNAVIKVTPTEAIYPTINNNVYYATIVSYDTRNFKFSNPADKIIQFIIKNRKLTISMDAVYTLKESDNYFEFSDWANSSNYPEYKIRITGLNPTSSILGNVVTDDWHEGLYSNNNVGTFTFGWDINGYRIKSSTLFEADGITPKDETSYYDLTLNINVRIKYMTFDYELCIDTTTVGTYADSTLANTIGVNSYLYSSDGTTLDIEFGADGYTHELLAWVKNTTGANVEFEWKDSLDNSHSANTMNFKEIWNYEVILNIKKDKFYDVQLKINLNVVKGDYKFDDLTKEYDRNPVDPIAKLLRKPIDFKPDYLTFAYYNASGSALTSAPSQIGSYKVIINTLPGHSEWFNDLSDLTIPFQITKRSIIIETVDDIPPIDSKVYDGSPWEKRYVKSTEASLNLLPGDMLTGVFLSKRATIGTYSSSVPNDFIASSFRVDNDTLNEQTGYYRIVFKGDYSILPREIKYTKSGVTKVYDGLYSWIDVQVQDPTTGYKIYYSEVSITTEDMDTDESKWVEGYPYTYNEPGVYTVYFKIVADTYKTVYDYEVVTITGKDVVYTASDVYVNYDGFEHGIEVTGLSPWNAVVKYAIIDPLTFDGSFESLNFSPVMPKFIGNEYGPTEYSYAIEVSAPNYNTKYGQVTLHIDINGPSITLNVTSETVTYDGNNHGFKISGIPSGMSINDFIIKYAETATITDETTWIDATLIDNGDGTYSCLPYNDAATYPVTVKIYSKGYKPKEVAADVTINPISLGAITATGWTGDFDGKYHTVYLSNGGTITSSGIDPLDNSVVNGNPVNYYIDANVNGTNTVLDLDVKYSSVDTYGNADATTWQSTPISYKDVNPTGAGYLVYVMVSGQNVETKFLWAQIYITRASVPPVINISNQTIEYLARPVLDSEIVYDTIHDGITTFHYQAYNTGVLNPLYLTTNPMDVGKYRVTIDFGVTNNCLATSCQIDLEIVPRRLLLDYEKELEYDGTDQAPEVKVISNTTDKFTTTVSYVGAHIDIGSYTADVFINEPMNGNYYLDPSDDIISYKIVARKVYVTLDTTIEYDGVTYYSKYFDSQNLDPADGMTITNLLATDYLKIQITTNKRLKGKYTLKGSLKYSTATNTYFGDITGLANPYFGFKILSTAAPSGLDGLQDNFELKYDDGTGTYFDADYYEIVFDLTVEYLYPPLEVTVPDPQIYDYDGTEKSVQYIVNSTTGTGLPVLPTAEYWLLSSPDQTYTTLSFIEVGEYEIGFKFSAPNFEDYVGSTKIIIKQAVLAVNVDPLTKVYDLQPLEATWSINPSITIRDSEKPEVWYFDLEELEKAGFDQNDVGAFFLGGCLASDPFYETFMTNPKVTKKMIVDVGDYFTIVYFPGTRNIALTIGYETLHITKRPLYFNFIGGTKIYIEKPYDSYKVVVSMGEMEYDKVSGANSAPDAGLLAAHRFGTITFADCKFRTSSADARGEPGNGDPYEKDQDFEFFTDPYQSILITTDGTDNVCENYYPIVNPVMVGGVPEYQVQVVITRIDLPQFDVPEELTVQYDGNDALPKASDIKTPSDGAWQYYYRKVSDNTFSDPSPTPTYNEKNVGYYELYLTIKTGTNYYYWNRSNNMPYDETDGTYYYKKIKLTVIPKQAEIVWNELSFMYDGTDHTPSGYILDIAQNKRYIDVEIHDSEDNLLPQTTVKEAGTYVLYGSLTYATSLLTDINNYQLVNPIVQLNVSKRPFEVSYSAKENYLFTYWTKKFDETYFADATDPTWIAGHKLDMEIQTLDNIDGHFQYANQFRFNKLKVTDELGNDVTKNYEFNLNINVILQMTALTVRANNLETKYINQNIAPDIKLNYDLDEVQMSFSTVELDWDTGLEPATFVKELKPATEFPTFRNVGKYRIYYQFNLPNDSQNTYDGFVDLTITQADSYLALPDLDKVYDGSAATIVKSNLNGSYNGTFNDLEITYYYYQDFSTPLGKAPTNAGKYTVVVTDNADIEPETTDGKTNYSKLSVMKDFEISKREISLVVDDTWVINSPADLLANWSHSGDLLNNNSASDYYVENIVTSTGLRYTINSNVNLERKKYQYATTGTYDSNFTLNEFDVSWQAWYLNAASTALDTTVASNELTQNYTLRATINLTVRFKLIEYNIVDNVYTYDGTAKSFGPNVVVTSPSPSTCTIMFGTVKGTYDLTDNPQTLPGSHLAYVQISAPNYEIAEDKTILTIDHFRREDVGLDVTSINKTYDALVYDGTVASGGVPTVTWKNPSLVQFGETIPAQSSWTISYYKATGSDARGWKKASEPKSEVVDAGEYLIEIVIPAGVYYGETTLLEHFKISRRQVTVAGTAADYTYNGSTWQYNIYNNPDGLTITGLVNDGTNVHKFVSGTLFSSSVNSGIYQRNSETGKYIDFYPGYEIVDQNMDEVTVNYEYIVDVVLNIKKADMTFVWNIPDLTGGSFPYGYTYDQTKHYPSITIVAPTQAVIDASSAKILYSDDDVYYDEHEKDFTFVSNYRVYAKLKDVANYNDLTTFEDFSIIMAKNTLSVQDLSKVYDGSTVFNPKVVTLEGSEIAKDSWLTWLDSTGAVLSSRPSEVGSYKVRVTYPTNDNYEGVQVEQPFTISPNNFTVSFDTNNLVYNTLPQSPTPIFTSDTYPSLNINKMLVPGVDYTINYYAGTDMLLTTPIAEPSQVGTYIIGYELISSKALNNFTIANSTKYSNYYTISPREIEIKYSGSKSYLGTSPVVIAVSDITVTNLPTGVTYTTPINTIPAQWASIDNHAVAGTYPSGLFDNYYVFDSPDSKPHLVLTASSTDDDLANYIIKLDISLTVTTSSILYAVQEYDDVYDGKSHTFKFELSMGSGINYTLHYSIDNGATWSTDKPNQTDATPSPIKVLVKAVFNDATYPETIFGDDEPDSNKFYINIAKADSTLEISDEAKMMDKIYDGKLVQNPVVTYNTFIDEDKRDEKLQYKYYQQDVTSTGGTTYTLINVLDILNVGKYKVEITLGETKNFNASATKTILFEITKRDLIVRFPDVEEKTYDAVVWSALITNTGTTGASGAILEGVSGVPESGLVDGDMFTAILQSKSSNAGDYKVYPDDFTWQEAPKIYNGAGNNVTENYNIDVACWAKINEASFDGLFEAFDYIGYVDGLYHGIIINWLPGKTPLVAGLANPMTLITYTKTPYDSTSYSSTPVTEKYGTTTVYFRIEAPNYVTYDGSRKIELTPKPTGAPTIDWTGKIDGSGTDRVYDGNSYNYDPLNPDIILSNSDSSDTRVPTITYYMSDGTALTSAPIDAGEYYFTVTYDADADHAQAIFGEGKEYSFKIKPYALTVVWQGDKDPTSSDPMIMYYSGSQLTPSAEAEDTRTGVPSSGTKLESAATTPTLNITVTNPSTGIAEAVGYYTAHVVIDPAAPNNVAKNYILTNDTINYKIEASGPSLSPEPFPDPYPGTGPRPTPDDYVESITIDDLNYKNTLNVPFTFGDAELYVHVTFNYNTAGPHQFWYVFDQTNGEITKIYYDNFVPFTGTINQIFTVTPPKKDDGSPDWSLKYFDSSTTADPTDADYYYVPVKVVLTDKVNTNWNTVTKDVSDLSKQIVFEQLAPNPATGDIYIVEPGYETTYMWSPTPTGVVSYTGYDGTGTIYTYEMDGTELKFSIRVMISGALVGSTVDVELVEGVDYEIVWFNNTGPTTTGRFSVKNTVTSSYNFAIGNENPTDLVDKAGKFVINSPEPKYLKLKDDATIGYIYYEQDFTNETVTITELTYDDRADALDGTGAISATEASNIYLGHTYQGTSLYYLINQFTNTKSRIKIKDPSTGDYLYDQTDSSIDISTLTTDNVIDLDDPTNTKTDYIRTGLIVELYDKDTPTSTDTPIDTMQIIVSGDLDGDGFVQAMDSAEILTKNTHSLSDTSFISDINYLAGYKYDDTDLRITAMYASEILVYRAAGTPVINDLYKPV